MVPDFGYSADSQVPESAPLALLWDEDEVKLGTSNRSHDLLFTLFHAVVDLEFDVILFLDKILLLLMFSFS